MTRGRDVSGGWIAVAAVATALVALVALFTFLIPLADCPVCAAKDDSGHWTAAYHDIVAHRSASCDGTGKMTLYRKWKLNRLLRDFASGKRA